ncbi:T9SS type A sorting domain-containing protein [Flavobacterium sp.]|uniref:T9SS type A sorting domain-containing protein n=1 Tax=Flavobacterium sp. TaxID=239 RepID=UPI0039E271D7
MKLNYLKLPLLILLLNVFNVSAQNVEWAKMMTATGTIGLHAIAADHSGNSYVGGNFLGSANIAGIALANSNASGLDCFVAKFNASGQPIWVSRIGGDISQETKFVKTDATGNVYIAVTSNGLQTTIGGVVYNNEANSTDSYIVKYNTDGEIQWVRSINTVSSEVIYGFDVSAEGKVLLGCSSGAPSLTLGDYTVVAQNGFTRLMAALDTNGNYLFAKPCVFGKFKFCPDDSFYLCATFQDSVTIEGQTLLTNDNAGVNQPYGDIFLAKFDSEANLIWLNQYAGNKEDSLRSFDVDSEGSAYLLGNFTSDNLTFGFTALNKIQQHSDFMAKINSDGSTVWAKNICGNGIYLFTYTNSVDAAGNIFICGTYDGDYDFGNGVSLANYDEVGVNSTHFVIAFDNNGTPKWSKSANYTGVYGWNFITSNDSGDVFFTGNFNSTSISFDAVTLAGSSNPGVDGFLMKAHDSALAAASFDRASTGLFPNPAAHQLYVKNLDLEKNTKYQIIDMQSRIVQSGMLLDNNTGLDISELNAGFYVLSIGGSAWKFIKK